MVLVILDILDVIRNNEEFKRKKSNPKQELFDYDWLNE